MSSGSRTGGAVLDRVLPATRAVALFIVPFLAIAAVLLFGFPTRTGELFAWQIDPPLTAYLLASAYVGGIWFFVRTVAARWWHRVRHGFPAVVLFAGALLIATVLHLDRFSRNLSFTVWIILYATTPFAVALLWWLQRRVAGSPDAHEMRIPRGIRITMLLVGMASLLCGAALFLAPALFIPYWAWTLTPLTAQVVGAVLSLPGAVSLGMFVDDRWDAFRVLLQSQLISLCAMIVSLIAGRDALLWDRPMTPIFIGLVVVALVFYAGMTGYLERAARRA